MKILILGATGRTGKWLVNEALNLGYEVTVLVRNAAPLQKFASKKLNFFVGLPQDLPDLKRALQGCDAVISALNISRRTDFPWSALRAPKDLLSATTTNLVALCQQQNISRVMIISAWGVGDSRKEIPGWFRWLIDHSNIRFAYEDHERQENILEASNLDYTIVRPVGLTNSKNKTHVMGSFKGNPKPTLTVSRKALAHFMLEAFGKDYVRQTITISTP